MIDLPMMKRAGAAQGFAEQSRPRFCLSGWRASR